MTESGDHKLTVEPGSYKLTGNAVNATAFRPLSDNHPCYGVIGLITSECARMEHFLDAAIFDLAEVDPRTGASITGQFVGMHARYSALKQLAVDRQLPEAMHAEIKKQAKQAFDVANRRNRAVHDAWMEDVFSGESHQFRSRSKSDPTYGPRPVSLEELQADLAEVRTHLRRVMDLRGAIWEHCRK